jgi:hypothetical protein
MQIVNLKTALIRAGSSGWVQNYLEAFAAELISAGYAELPIRDYVRSAGHLGRWMDSRSRGIERLGDEALTEFANHECECPFVRQRGRRPSRRYVARARQFVDYLGRLGVTPSLPLARPIVGKRFTVRTSCRLAGPGAVGFGMCRQPGVGEK